jgi:hypothetical protein
MRADHKSALQPHEGFERGFRLIDRLQADEARRLQIEYGRTDRNAQTNALHDSTRTGIALGALPK